MARQSKVQVGPDGVLMKRVSPSRAQEERRGRALAAEEARMTAAMRVITKAEAAQLLNLRQEVLTPLWDLIPGAWRTEADGYRVTVGALYEWVKSGGLARAMTDRRQD